MFRNAMHKALILMVAVVLGWMQLKASRRA